MTELGWFALGVAAGVFFVVLFLHVRSWIKDAHGIEVDMRPSAPIDMILFCPHCRNQHIDAADPGKGWFNPPHRSHLCEHCRAVWRPADVATNGVAQIKTRGKQDTMTFSSAKVK